MLKKAFRSALSLLLVFCLLLGLSANGLTVLAADFRSADKDGDGKIIYVSIGDSMTNGYGLDGYEGQSGLMNYGIDTYANKFAAYLAGLGEDYEIQNDQVIFKNEETGVVVDHRQLAFSGMRAEDLHWLLDLQYTNTDLMIRLGQSWVQRQNAFGSAFDWEEDNWPEGQNDIRDYWYMPLDEHQYALGQTAGDQRTWYEVTDPSSGRLGDGIARMLYTYYNEGNAAQGYFKSDYATQTMIDACIAGVKSDFNESSEHDFFPANKTEEQTTFFNTNWLQVAGEFYQESVTDADVISLALGNTNFGTWMFDWMQDIFGADPSLTFEQLCSKFTFYADNQFEHVYQIADFDEDMQAQVESLMAKIDPLIDKYLSGNVSEGQKEYLEYLVKYCVLSYIVNYMGAVDRIVALNHDVELIQVALINAYDTGNKYEGEGMGMAEVIDMLYEPLNAFIAALPTYMQAQGKWTDATFYYADAGHVQTLSEVFGNDFYTYDDAAITYDAYQAMLADGSINVSKLACRDSVIRNRMQYWLAATRGCYQDRDHANGAENCSYCKGYPTYYYLWLEMGYYRSVGQGTSWGWCDVLEYGEILKGVLGNLECDFPDDLTLAPSNTSSPYYQDYQTWLAAYNAGSDMSDTKFIQKFFNEYRVTYITEADVKAFEKMSRQEQNALLNGEHSYARDKAFTCAMYLAIEDATIRAGKSSFGVEDMTGVKTNVATFQGAIELFAKKMGLTGKSIVGAESKLTGDIDAYTLIKNFSDALVADGPSRTMLCLGNRIHIGTGIGGHTSEGGHKTMYNKIVEVYEKGYTAQDQTENNLHAFLKAEYPNLYNMMFGSENMGDMDDLAIIITMLKMSGSAALEGVDLDALEAEIRQANKDYTAAHNDPEEQAKAKAAAQALYNRLIALATAATGVKYEVTEKSFYVSLGDSNVNGYGLDGYVNNTLHGVGQIVAGSAPVLLAKELYGDDYLEHFGQYAQGALRCEDLLYILGVTEGIVLDDYYYTEIEPNLLKGNITDTRTEYINILTDADLISICIGGGNVTTFVGEQVDRVLGNVKDENGNPKPIVEMDWAKIGYTDDALTELNELLDLMVPLMDAMGMMDKYLPEGLKGEIENPAEFGRVLLESLLYGYASYNYYYPMVLDRIREINRDAQILILGMFNPVDDWTMEMDGEIIDIGGIASNVMEMANLQNLAYAMQNANTSFVDLSKNITFLDEQYKDSTPTFDVYYKSILEGDGLEVHASAKGHEYMFSQMLTALSGEDRGTKLEALMAELYAVLQDDYLTTQEKLELLADLYEAIKDSNDLDRYPEVAVLEEIHAYLYANKYLNDDQTLDIVMYTYERMLDRILTDEEKREVIDHVYETLLLNEELSDEDRIAIIGNVYAILDAHYALSANSSYLRALENIVDALYEKDYLNDEQAFAIVHYVYGAVKDGVVEDWEIRQIATFVYYTLFNINMVAPMSIEGAVDEIDPEMTAAEKLEILMIIYDELKAEGAINVEEYPQIEVIENLYDDLTTAPEGEEPLLTPEQTFAIIDKAFEVLVADGEDVVIEDAVTEIIEVVNTEVFENVEIPTEKKLDIIEKIGTAVGELANGEGVVPGVGGGADNPISFVTEYMTVAKAIVTNLKAEKLMDDAHGTALIAVIYDLLMGNKELDPVAIINEVYEIVFDRDDLSLEDKIQIVVIVYNTLAEHKLIKDLIDIPTTDEAEDYFVELGGKIWDILDENWADVVVELQGKLETLYGDLEAETLKLNDELYKLVELQKAELTKLIAERDELDKKLADLNEQLEAACNGGAGTYSVNTVKSNETELIEELKAAIAETEAAIDALDAAIAALTDKITADLQGIEEIENAIKQIKAEIAETETALNEVLAVIDQLNTDLKDVYDATVVLNAALENLYGMTLGQVDGKAVLEAVNTIIDTVPAIVENLEFVYDKTQVAIEQVEAAIDTFHTFADNIQTNVDNITAGLDELAGLTADQLEAIKNAAAACEKLVKDFVDTNLPTVEKALEETYDELEKLANEEIAMFEQWFNENESAVLGGAAMLGVAIVYLSRDYADVEYKDGILTIKTAYAEFKYVDGKLSYTLEDEGEKLVNKFTGILNDYVDDLRAARDEAQQWWDENYPKAEAELNTKLDELYDALVELEDKVSDYATDEYEAAKKAIEDEIKRLEALRDQLIEEGKKVDAYLIMVEGAISAVEDALNGVINAGHVVDGDLMDLFGALTNLHGELVDLHNAVVDLHDVAVDELFEIFGLCGIVADEFVNVLNTLPAYVDVLVNAVELVTSIDTWHKLDEVLQDAVKDLADRLVEFLSEEETQQLIKDLVAQYGPVVAEQLLEALVYLFEEYGHDVAVAFYNYLYNNPEEVIAFFNEYGSLILDLIVEYGEAALVITALALTWYGEDLATYLVENHETILANLAYWWNIHDEKMIDLLQVYAEALGLCDAVRDEIANLENAIESLEKDLNDKVAQIEKELADLYEQLETATGAAKEAIEAKIAELEAKRDALIADMTAKIEAAKAAIEDLKDALNAAIADGLADLEAVKDALLNLDEKIAELIEAANKAVLGEVNNAIANIEKAIEKLDEALYQLLGVVYEDMKDALNELVLYLVDELADAACKYLPGVDKAIYDYLYNHADEVIAFFNEYGYILADLVKEYGEEALGIIAYALYMYGEDMAAYLIENYETVLENLLDWAEEYGDRVVAMLQVYAEALGLCDAVRDQIADLEAQLEALKAELENASEEVKAAIEAEIAKIEAAIEELKEKLEALEEAIHNTITDVNATVEEIMGEIENLIEQIDELVEEIKQAAAEIKAMIETAIDEAVANLEAAVETLKAEAKNQVAALKEYVDKLVYDALHADYEIDVESEYVALGDGAYADLLAQYLADLVAAENAGYSYGFTDLSVAGSKITGLAAMIEANLDVIANADLISIGYGNEAFAEAAVYELFNALANGTVTSYDWEALVGPEAAAEIEKMLAKVYEELVAQGMDVTVMDLSDVTVATAVTAALECYAYHVVTYMLYLPEAIDAIHAINPDALVVVVGMSNPFKGTTFAFGESVVAFDEYVDYIIHAANVEGVTYAILNENTVFVPVMEAESSLTNVTMDFNDPFYVINLLSQIIEGTWGIEITEAGNAYIVEQIKKALTITVNPNGLLGDVNRDGLVDVEDAMLILQLEALLIDGSELNLAVGDVSGDGLIDVEDAMLILQFEAEIIEKFPAEG